MIFAKRPIGGRNVPAVSAPPLTTFPNGYAARVVFVVDAGAIAAPVADVPLPLLFEDAMAASISEGGVIEDDVFGVQVELITGEIIGHESIPMLRDAETGAVALTCNVPTVSAGLFAVAVYFGKPGAADLPIDLAKLEAWPTAVFQSYGHDAWGIGSDAIVMVNGVTFTIATETGWGGEYDAASDIMATLEVALSLEAHALYCLWQTDIVSKKGVLAAGDTDSDRNARIQLRDESGTGFQGGATQPLIYSCKSNDAIRRYESSAGRAAEAGTRSVMAGGSTGQPLQMWINGLPDVPSFQGNPDNVAETTMPGPVTIAAPFRLGHGGRSQLDGTLDGRIMLAVLFGRAPSTSFAELMHRWWGDMAAHVFAHAAETPDDPGTMWSAGTDLAGETDDETPVDFDPIARCIGSGLAIGTISTPANGTAEEVSGVVRYTPGESHPGTDAFTIEVEDDGSSSIVFNCSLIVTSSAAPPSVTELPEPLVTRTATSQALLDQYKGESEPGHHIVIAFANPNLGTISRSGSPTQPIVYKSDTILGRKLSADANLTNASHVRLYGIDVDTRNLGYIYGEDVWLIRCRFMPRGANDSTQVRIRAAGSGFKSWYCEHSGPGRHIAFDTGNAANGVNGHVWRGHFHDVPRGPNGSETITVGFSSNVSRVVSNTLIDECFFYQCNYGTAYGSPPYESETIACKGSSISVRRSTFNRTANLNIRHGRHIELTQIFLRDCPHYGGLQVLGPYNLVANLRAINSPVGIWAGNVFHTNFPAGGNYEAAFAARVLNSWITGTVAGEVGAQFSGGFSPLVAAQQTMIRGHVGNAWQLLGGGAQTGTSPAADHDDPVPSGNIAGWVGKTLDGTPYVTPDWPVELSAGDVGPGAGL